jgi:hypothetical protein
MQKSRKNKLRNDEIMLISQETLNLSYLDFSFLSIDIYNSKNEFGLQCMYFLDSVKL